jgi:aminoglycoside phosphotransferase (APT) family kinase protein
LPATPLDEADLRRRLERGGEAWHAGATLSDTAVLPGGNSSIVYQAHWRGVPDAYARTVVKIAPPGLPPVRNRDMLRQGRVIAALGAVDGVRVPDVLFTDDGAPPEIPPFIVTNFLPGECYEPILEAATDPRDHDEVRARAFAAARMLAALHAAPADTLAGLDPPDGEREVAITLVEEIDRWTRALDTVDDSMRTGYQACAAALHASMPAGVAPVVVHGDYRLGNMLCSEGAVYAIIDWELWARSDPRTDLAWFLFFTDEAEHAAVQEPVVSGMPTSSELLAEYERAAGATVADLDWFHALVRYKEAGATALIMKRLAKHGMLPEGRDPTRATVPHIVDAMRILDGAGS